MAFFSKFDFDVSNVIAERFELDDSTFDVFLQAFANFDVAALYVEFHNSLHGLGVESQLVKASIRGILSG